MKEFPKEGKISTVYLFSEYYEDLKSFLIKRCGRTDSKMSETGSNGIGWNENSYWFIKEFNNSRKKEYSWVQLKPFVMGEEEALKPKVEEFKLPEKWCIKGYQEVVDYSNKHGANKGFYALDVSLYHHYPPFNGRITSTSKHKPGYTEITLEQFKKYVLKEEEKPKETHNLIPGSWYEITDEYGEKWVFKFKEFNEPDELDHTLAGTPDDGFTDDESFLYGNPKDCKPANMEEVYSLFPTEKPIPDLELMPEGFEPPTNMEQLLEEAKRKYPIGTRYKCALTDSEYTVEKPNFSIYNSNTIHTEYGRGTLYYNGKWAEIISTSEAEEVLVFGKYKIGDIVVSLTTMGNSRKEGDLFKVLPNSSKSIYYAPKTSSSRPQDWRKATKEEEEAYNKGITNIHLIKDYVETINKPKFEIGKWYQGKDSKFYGKLTGEIEGTRFPSREYINEVGNYNSRGSYFSGKKWTEQAREVPLSEIQQYLPEGHPDKFKVISSSPVPAFALGFDPATIPTSYASKEIKNTILEKSISLDDIDPEEYYNKLFAKTRK